MRNEETSINVTNEKNDEEIEMQLESVRNSLDSEKIVNPV